MAKNSLIVRMRAIVNSIAFYPAIIASFFVILSYLMIHLDYSDFGKGIKTHWNWLKLRDAGTARSIISVVAAGILSLAVFSFTMVMVVLNQAASQMSNRILDKLIGNQFQQIVLGIYIGTIVYSLFLLSAIRDIDEGIYVPALSTYLLIIFAVTDIFLFIYFLHYITQSIKYSVIIKRIKQETAKELKDTCFLSVEPLAVEPREGQIIRSDKAGIFIGFDKKGLTDTAEKLRIVVSFLHPVGTFLLENAPLATVTGKSLSQDDLAEKILSHVYVGDEDGIGGNYYNGLRQLTEIAIKALSPGINDPGTAVQSLRSIVELLAYRMSFYPANSLRDGGEEVRVITMEKSFEDLLRDTLLPIWDYGKNDRFVQHEMQHLLSSLLNVKHNDFAKSLLQKVKAQKLSN